VISEHHDLDAAGRHVRPIHLLDPLIYLPKFGADGWNIGLRSSVTWRAHVRSIGFHILELHTHGVVVPVFRPEVMANEPVFDERESGV